MKRRFFIQTLFIGSAGRFFINPKNISAAFSEENTIKLKMIYNNIGNSEEMVPKWGLSVWIEFPDTAILFDAGGYLSTFMENVKSADLDLKKLSKIVISHNHWDHIAGIGEILEDTDYRPELYVVSDEMNDFTNKYPKAIIHGIDSPKEIIHDLWTSGQLLGENRSESLYEQSLILVRENSLILLTGCSHSGIDSMAEKVLKLHKNKHLELIAGGFHLMRKEEEEILEISKNLKDMGVKNIAPSHCTGDLALELFRKEWGESFKDFNLGDELSI